MEPITILIWMLVFLAFIFLQSLMINGIKAAMDGETEVMPNGKHKDSEMILYPFYKWLTQMADIPKKRIYYEGDQFRNLLEKLYVVYKDIMPGMFPKENVSSYINLQTDEEVTQMEGVARIIKKEMDISTDIDGRHIRFYKEYDNYKFSKWVRKPFGQCIKCMASVYTLIPFWFLGIVIFGLQWWLFPLYVVNVCCVSYVDYLIYKK